MRELFGYRTLLANLVLKDLKLKYRGSILGLIWSLLNPLLTLGVYTLAFRYILRVQMDHYAFFLMIGLLPWNFFAGALLASTGAILNNSSLVKKVYFPREILPVATVLFHFAQLLLALAVFLPALGLLSGVILHSTALLVFPLLALHLLFTIGLALFLSAVTTTLRDVAHLTEVALMLLFWATPIVYPVSMAPPAIQNLFRASPAAAFAIAYQEALFWGRLPDGLVTWSLLGWTALALVVGHVVFRSHSPSFAEEV